MFSVIASGQTLQKNGLVAIHEWTLTLHDGVTMDQFLEHWKTNFFPEMKKALPELEPYILQSITEENKFAGLYYWNDVAVAGKYNNPDGSPTEAGAAAYAKLMPLIEGLSQFGEFTWTEENWLIIE